MEKFHQYNIIESVEEEQTAGGELLERTVLGGYLGAHQARPECTRQSVYSAKKQASI